MRNNGVAWAGLVLGILAVMIALSTSGDTTAPAQAVLPAPPGGPSTEVLPNQTSTTTIISVEVDEVSLGYFNSLSGLASENDVRERIVGNVVESNPDKLHWDRIALSRGLTGNLDLFNWRKLVVDGQIAQARKNVSIVLYDMAFQEIARFNLASAWPCRYEAGPFTPESSVVVESVELCHNGFVRVP